MDHDEGGSHQIDSKFPVNRPEVSRNAPFFGSFLVENFSEDLRRSYRAPAKVIRLYTAT